MILKEIVISGFKSFADPTKVDLARGVTAIVGPNGCGKSNIADAIRWVLGEQSAKALRGNKMQDVIFQGTEKRKPLNLCEVSLTFTECEEQLGTAYNEVEIRRRVSRDGKGDYFLNGQVCRLKDIQNLFMDTGVGRESYSFMAQGQISKIIDANPAGRRILFEEAAGISKYKSQRKEALNKLGHVDQNLQRVSDKIDILARRMGSVKRQASKTLRYKRLKHRLTHLDLASIRYKHSNYVETIENLNAQANELRSEVGSLQEIVSTGEGTLEESRNKRAQFFETVKSAQEKVFDLRNEKDQAESRGEFALTRCEDLQSRIEEISTEIADLDRQLNELGSKASNSAEMRREHEENMGASEQNYQERLAELEAVQERLVEKEDSIRGHKQKLMANESNIARLRSNCTTLEVDLKTAENKQEGIREQLLELNNLESQRAREAEDAGAAIEQKEADAEQAAAEEQEAKLKTESLNGQFRDLQIKIQESDRIVAKLTASLQLLENMQSKFEGFSDGAKAILQGKLDGALGDAKATPLSKCVTVEEAYTQQFETMLGNGADAIILGEAKTAINVSQGLQEQSLGRAALVIDAPKSSNAATAGNDTLTAASQVVKAKDAAQQSLVDGLLNGCYFCESLEQFLSFWESNSDFDFQLIVTANNELIDRRGLIFGGHSRKQGRETSLIQREAEIQRLKKEAGTENDKLTELNEDAMRLQADLDAAEARAEECHTEVVELKGQISSLRAQEQSAQNNLQNIKQSIVRAEEDLNNNERLQSEAQERLSNASKELQEAEAVMDGSRESISTEESAIEQLRLEREKAQERLNDVRIDRAEKQRHLEILTQGLDNIEAQKADINSRLGRRQQDITSINLQIDELKEESEREQERAKEIGRALETTAETLQKENEALQAAENSIRESETLLGEKRERLHQQEGSLNKLDVELAKQRSQLEFLHEKADTEYGIELKDIDWKAELWKADEEFETRINLDELEEEDHDKPKVKKDRGEPTEDDLAAMDNLNWSEIDSEINTLRSRIQAMGEINPAAIEEYTETKEEYDFLKGQSDDLWNAKEELMKAIDEINETSQRLFEETFEKVRENFKQCYKKINGGKADLELIASDDVLESGIEIMAQPIGTKLQTLSLLSGGQKTMTAVSLLFAIYMVKPSPFCVLDELDAPLDDANVGRFTDMLSEFLDYSQFLIITHNKRTLNVANTLYGVTMQEPGVTRLISLRFNKSQDGPDYVDDMIEEAAKEEDEQKALAGSEA